MPSPNVISVKSYGWQAIALAKAVRQSAKRDGGPGNPSALVFVSPPLLTVHYVYQIQSVDYPEEFYTGSTDNLKARLDSHDAGRSPHTAKHKPWRLVTYHAYANREKALDLEAYLKSGSGRAFTKCHLR